MMRKQTIWVGIFLLTLVPAMAPAENRPALRLLPPVQEEKDTAASKAEGEASAKGDSGGSADEGKDGDEKSTDTGTEELTVTPAVDQELAWYEWVMPSHWDVPDPWETSFELGIDGSEGNSQTLTLRGGVNVKRKVDWSDLRVEIIYVRASTEKLETKNNGLLSLNHDWLFKDSPWSLFGKMRLIYDEFKAFDVRLVLNSGLSYRFIDNDATSFKGRFGAGASREFRGPDDRWVPEAVFGSDFEHKLTERQKLTATIDYMPDWGDFNDYRLRTHVAWKVLLDKATNMNLKFGIIDRYDSTPNGRRPNDLDYSLMLLWSL